MSEDVDMAVFQENFIYRNGVVWIRFKGCSFLTPVLNDDNLQDIDRVKWR